MNQDLIGGIVRVNKSKTIYFIGCGVLGPDIHNIADQLNLTIKKKLLPGGLHNNPDELRKRLQTAIDTAAMDESCVRIIVGYGLCGNGTVGIKSPGIPLVFPKVHDCIALFLGSDRAYKEEFAKYPGTFYISTGWYVEKEAPKKEKPDQIWVGSHAMGSKEIKDKYGKSGGRDIIDFFSSWQKNYQRAAFIDTGIGKSGQYAAHAKNMAEKYGWAYHRLKGNLSLMTRLLTATDSDEQILVVPPNHVTIYSAVESGLGAAAPTEVRGQKDQQPRFLVLDDEMNQDLSIRYGLGIDAGGTYTDAAIFDFKEKRLISKNKALTTKWDFSIGIDQALSRLDDEFLSKVELVSVSTTLATNAIVEGEGQKAGLILMSGNGDVSDELITHRPRVVVEGQMRITGQEKQPVDPDEIRKVASDMIEKEGVTAFAVSGFAGAVNPAHELEIKRILQEETGMAVSCGHELSDLLNFVVRAQTAVLNARIIPRMIKFFRELDLVMAKRGIHAPVMVVKGDGTLMSSAMAKDRPVETILSGPAASVAGARLLTGNADAMVVDIGGTTTDTAELADGLVEVCESGARVGGYATHVKALNMRTAGLGGDSLICWDKSALIIGPRRVAPVVWADALTPDGVGKALAFMESRIQTQTSSAFSQIILVAMKGNIPFTPTENEDALYKILLQRPHAMKELAEKMGIFSTQFLPMERLEQSGLIQRCGLTPTDLLHINGSFKKWPCQSARRMVEMLARRSQKDPEELLALLLDMFNKNLARELLKKQLAKDVDVDDQKESPLSSHLMDCILSEQNDKYSITARFEDPIIGIGAPVHYFLPDAGQRLNAKVIIPENADVANALGAITSCITIKQRASIRPDDLGHFIVEGIMGCKSFRNIDKAEAWAVEQLKNSVQQMGRTAGTSRKTVEMEIRDRIVNASNGTSLFLDRTLMATLSGSPDLVLESVNPQQLL